MCSVWNTNGIEGSLFKAKIFRIWQAVYLGYMIAALRRIRARSRGKLACQSGKS